MPQPSMAGSPRKHNWPRSLWVGRIAPHLQPSLSTMLVSAGVCYQKSSNEIIDFKPCKVVCKMSLNSASITGIKNSLNIPDSNQTEKHYLALHSSNVK